MLLVILIMAVLAGLFWVNTGQILHSEDLAESGRRVRSLVAMCRAEAMNQSRRYRIRMHRDGTIDITRQVDPLLAAHLYAVVKADWANTDVLIGEVWVHAVQQFPFGPPPLNVEDDQLDLTKFDTVAVTDVAQLERPFEIWFEPDGTCTSARWVLRHERGAGIRMLLDGRLGRVTLEDAEPAGKELVRPAPTPIEEKMANLTTNEAEVLAELRSGEGSG